MAVDRFDIVRGLVARIAEKVPAIKLCKAYEGELQGAPDAFLTAVRGVLPAALVISEGTTDEGSKNRMLARVHTLTVYIAGADFTNKDGFSGAYHLLDDVLAACHGYAPEIQGCGDFKFISDQHVGHNEAVVLYSQKYRIKSSETL